MTINNATPSLTPATQTFHALNAAFAGLLTEEAAAHGHQTGGETATVLLLFLGRGLLILHRLGRRVLSTRGRVVSLGRGLLVGLLVRHVVGREKTGITRASKMADEMMAETEAKTTQEKIRGSMGKETESGGFKNLSKSCRQTGRTNSTGE